MLPAHRADCVGGGDVHREQLAQQSGRGIAIQVAHVYVRSRRGIGLPRRRFVSFGRAVLIHGILPPIDVGYDASPPVGPKRSVFTRAGVTQLDERCGRLLTIGVGPHTNSCAVGGNDTAASIRGPHGVGILTTLQVTGG